MSGLLTEERKIQLSSSEFIIKLKNSYAHQNFVSSNGKQFSNNLNYEMHRNNCNYGDENSIWSNLRLILGYIKGYIDSLSNFISNDKKSDNLSKLQETGKKILGNSLDCEMRENFSELLNISFFSISSFCSSVKSESNINNIGNVH